MSADDSHQPAQGEFFISSIYQALTGLVAELGCAKDIAAEFFPDIEEPDDQVTRLHDCLNPARRHKLSLEQFMRLLELGHDRAAHGAINWICDQLGYSRPAPISIDDRIGEVQRDMQADLRRLERKQAELQQLIARRR